MANSKPLRLYSHATGPKWIPPDPETDHFCSRGTVPFMNRRPDRTGMSKWAKQLFLAVLLVLKGTGPGVYTVSDSFGKETASNWTCFLGDQEISCHWEWIGGGPCEHNAYLLQFLDRNWSCLIIAWDDHMSNFSSHFSFVKRLVSSSWHILVKTFFLIVVRYISDHTLSYNIVLLHFLHVWIDGCELI